MVWGEFLVDEAVEGGVLRLNGGDNESRRVYAGPSRMEGRQSCGVVAVYTDNTPTGQIRGKLRYSGLLDLFGIRRDADEGGKAVALATLECADTAVASERWGRLTLRTLVPDAADATGQTDRLETAIEVDAGKGLGFIRISDARRPDDAFAILEVDELGPQLYLWGGGRYIRISPQGIEQSPDKALEEVPAVEPDVGDIRGGVGVGVEIPRANPRPELNLVAAHPEDPTADIYYNVLEGPEVGVYVRGSVRLRDGKALARLPDHFRHVAAIEGLTVQLTPRSAASKGVAATRVTVGELEVTELGEGTGEYDVDFVVHGVRQGREQFRVIRPKRAARLPLRQAASEQAGAEQDAE